MKKGGLGNGGGARKGSACLEGGLWVLVRGAGQLLGAASSNRRDRSRGGAGLGFRKDITMVFQII